MMKKLLVRYQPDICLQTGTLVGVKAVAGRLESGKDAANTAASFVRFDPQFLMQQQMERNLLQVVSAALDGWRQNGRIPLPVTVSLCSRQLMDERFICWLDGLLDGVFPHPHLVEFEIPESGLLQASCCLLNHMKNLANAGFFLSLGGFGSFCFSLDFLKDLPVKRLKLAASTTRKIHADWTVRRVVQALIEQANNLDLKVVAEGISSKEQADTLRNLGCHHAQGSYFHDLLSEREIGEVLHLQANRS